MRDRPSDAHAPAWQAGQAGGQWLIRDYTAWHAGPLQSRQLLQTGLALSALGLATGCGIVRIEPVRPVPRVGILAPVGPNDRAVSAGLQAFQQELVEPGQVESRTFVLDYRQAEGDRSRLPALAAELVDSGVQVIVTWSTPAVLAARASTTTIPIVMAGADPPVVHGWADNRGWPSGNVTPQRHAHHQTADREPHQVRPDH